MANYVLEWSSCPGLERSPGHCLTVRLSSHQGVELGNVPANLMQGAGAGVGCKGGLQWTEHPIQGRVEILLSCSWLMLQKPGKLRQHGIIWSNVDATCWK